MLPPPPRLKNRYSCTRRIHGVTSRKAAVFIVTVRTPLLTMENPNQCRCKRSRISMLRRRQTSCNFADLLEGSSDTGTTADAPISTAYRHQARSLHCQRDRLLERRAATGRIVLWIMWCYVILKCFFFQPQKLYSVELYLKMIINI